jgi:hypothetical protein
VEQGERKKLIWLAGLVGLLVVIWGYRALFTEQTQNTVQGPGSVRHTAPGPPAKPVVVNLALLEGEKPRLVIGRNIFDPTYKEPKVLPPDLASKSGKNANADANAKPKPLAAVSVGPPKDSDADGVPDNIDKCPGTPPGVPVDASGCQPGELSANLAKAEMGKIKFVGFLKRSNRTDVFLTYRNAYFVVTKGDEISNGFYLKDIGKDFLRFADKATGAEVMINVDFSGKKADKTVTGGKSVDDKKKEVNKDDENYDGP